MLTPQINPDADEALGSSLKRRLARNVDIHVDQLRISVETGAAEAAQLARAVDASAARNGDQDRVSAKLALIAGSDQSTVQADVDKRILNAPAAPLPGLELAGYRALESRANRQIDGWTAQLVPPADIDPPEIGVTHGVVDGAALDIAAWGSARLGRGIVVQGGGSTQRDAVVDGIIARGGQAEGGSTNGRLRLQWAEPETPPIPASIP